MKSQNSPEWLPSGWTLHINVLKSGRKIEYYLNSETGKKFFSKDDLIHHARVQGIEFGHSQPSKRKFESDSEINRQIDVVRHIYESPDWLPHAWTMEVKTKNSGRKKGKTYKCFVEVATGRKFYSKPAVFKYLENLKCGSSKLKEASISSQPSSKVGSSKPKEASINTEPLSEVGLTKHKEESISTQFLSKVGSSKPLEASISTQPSSKVVFEKCTMDDLPPGWVKEVKITKSAHRTRKDPFYTDPATGYVFRSRKDVDRYLATGKISRYTFLPKKKLFTDQDLPSPATEREIIIGIPARGQFLSGEYSGYDIVCSDVEINALSTPEASIKASEKILQAETVLPVALTAEVSLQSQSEDHASDNSGDCEKNPDLIVLARPVPVGTLDRKKVDTAEGSGLTYKFDERQEQDSLKDGKKSGFQHKTQSNSSKSKTKKGLNLPRRTSKRLAGVEPILEVGPVSSIIDLSMEADPVSSVNEHDDVADNPVSIVEGLQDPASACSNEGGVVDVSADEPILNSEADTKQEACSNDNGVVNVSADEPILNSEADTKQEACSNEGCAVNVSADEPIFKSEADTKQEACSNEGGVVNVSADELILNSEADIKQEEFIENKTKERITVKANNSSSKATKRKMPNLPRRSSKRLAGLGPELLTYSVSAGHAPQNATTSSRDQKAISVCPNSDDLPTGVHQQHKTEAGEQREKVSQQVQPIHQQDVLNERSEGLDANSVIGKTSEPKISPPFEEFLADPCLEFAYKTLTGAIPFENAAYSMLFENPANIMNQKESHANVEENSNRKTQTKSSKSKNGKSRAPRRSSEQKTGFQFNPMSNSISREISVDAASVKSGKTKPVRRSGSARKNARSQKVEIGPGSVHVQHGSPGVKISQEWRVNNSKQPLHYLNFCGDHSQKPELQPFFPSAGEQSQRPEPQSSFLAGDFWSDPCLEFAFKTLTGSLPVEDHLLAPGYFQQQVSSLQPQRESYIQQPVETYPSQRDGNMAVGNLALPDFGFPSFSQTDISAHFDSPEKQPPPSCNMSVPPSGNVNMPSCGSIASQPPHIDGNKGLHGKIKS